MCKNATVFFSRSVHKCDNAETESYHSNAAKSASIFAANIRYINPKNVILIKYFLNDLTIAAIN